MTLDRLDAVAAAEDAAWLLSTGWIAMAATLLSVLPDTTRRAVELAWTAGRMDACAEASKVSARAAMHTRTGKASSRSTGHASSRPPIDAVLSLIRPAS